MQEDKLLQKMQRKVLNFLGPLSKIWQKIADSTQRKTDRVEIDLYEIKELTESVKNRSSVSRFVKQGISTN